jgi:hypothetical protein
VREWRGESVVAGQVSEFDVGGDGGRAIGFGFSR